MYNQSFLQKLIIERIEENLNLDYKAAASLERNEKRTVEISKDVSAFANSDGGLIIYGLKEDSFNKHIASEIDPVNRLLISKEWLEQIIQGKIRPRIDGIKIHPIEIDGDKQKVVYVVDIPKSSTAHQADDKKYYKRFNFNSEPMYDYEIKDILNRTKNPIIDIEFEINIPNGGTYYYLKAYAKNNGAVLAQYINCYIKVPIKFLDEKYVTFGEDVNEYFADNTIRDLVDTKGSYPDITTIFGPSRYDPILPRMRMKLDFKIPKLTEFYFDHHEAEIECVVYTDNAEPRTTKIKLKEISIKR